MILLRHQNNYIEYLSDNNVLLLQKVNILVCVLYIIIFDDLKNIIFRPVFSCIFRYFGKNFPKIFQPMKEVTVRVSICITSYEDRPHGEV